MTIAYLVYFGSVDAFATAADAERYAALHGWRDYDIFPDRRAAFAWARETDEG